MKLSGWGRYPVVESEPVWFQREPEARDAVREGDGMIPHGLGRSYGDAALSDRPLMTRRFACALAFDETTGVVEVEAGISLAELLDAFVPRGWFLGVTPGTRFVTVGGAIASDVHGKNHHVGGCFSECVLWFDLMLPDGTVVRCDREGQDELFRATCGGMGLTGLILRAALRLKSVQSAWIEQTTFKAKNLAEVFVLFEENKSATYSVAWIDCLSSGDALGRSLLMVGENACDGGLERRLVKTKRVPFDTPSFLMNHATVTAFNALYYHRIWKPVTRARVHYEPFFYPLDAIGEWNRIYGKTGFTQYQFVLPLASSHAGLHDILSRIARAGLGSFLAVLKLFGKANNNLLSFPMEGYTLALDFKIEPKLFPFLDELDKIVLDHGGRLYLTKDARMSPETFASSYPGLAAFRDIRARYGMRGTFESRQSRRLEI